MLVVGALGTLAALGSARAPAGSARAASSPPGLSQVGEAEGVARVVRDFAPVYSVPSTASYVVWRLYESSQVAVTGAALAAEDTLWRPVRLWNAEDGWLEADALSFAPYPPPAPPARAPAGATPTPAAPSGPCQPKPEPRAPEPLPLHAPAHAVGPATLSGTLDGEATGDALAAGTSAVADAWAVGADGRARYHVIADGAGGWTPPGTVALQAADPVGRLVNGRPITAPIHGKGLWFVLDSREHGTSPATRVAHAAAAAGLSHLYVEVATSRGGFWGARWLDALLPAARAVGLRVIGSVYVCLDDLPADLALSLEVARYRTPDGLALDGLTADVEETLVAENVRAYGELLRQGVGDDYLLVATVYPPESYAAPRYPWPALAASWNAVAPMAYWRQMESRAFTADEVDAYTRRNLAATRALVGRPDLPVEMLGQLFEMGRPRLLGPDPPTPAEITAAAAAARAAGAVGISYFDWTRATPAHWQALAAIEW
ncbi:MAG TPA: hypothetical protein VFE37_15545 [Chloroflexota bacterium]|nr:hypothetical protein [Chloroflexota bacterium]